MLTARLRAIRLARVRSVLVLSAVLGFATHASARDIKFWVIADPQYAKDHLDDDVDLARERVVQLANRFREMPEIRGVAITGDLTQDSQSEEFNAYYSDFRQFAEVPLLSDLEHIFDGLGNHDQATGNESDEILEHVRRGSRDASRGGDGAMINNTLLAGHLGLQAAISTPHYAWRWGSGDDAVLFVQLNLYPGRDVRREEDCDACGEQEPDSCYDGHIYVYRPYNSIAYLRAVLEEFASDGTPVVLFHHYGLDDASVESGGRCHYVPGSYWWNAPGRVARSPEDWHAAERGEYWNTLAGYNVLCIFSGHKHGGQYTDWYGSDELLRHSSLGTVRPEFLNARVIPNFCIPAVRNERSRYAEVTIDDDSLQVAFFDTSSGAVWRTYPEIQITAPGERLSDHDCNSNGMYDAEEIERNGRLDENADGILDTCQAFALYVDISAPAGGSGASPGSPLNSLQAALEEAEIRQREGREPLDWIFVSEGVYGRANNETFQLWASTNVFGGFPSFASPWVAEFIVDAEAEIRGQARANGVEERNLDETVRRLLPEKLLTIRDPVRRRSVLTSRGEVRGRTGFPTHVVTIDGQVGVDHTTIFDGFTIRNGRAFDADNDDGNRGGGMFIRRGVPTIRNCLFVDNAAGSEGGAIYIQQSADGARIIDCTFHGNRVAGDRNNGGGAIYYAGGEPLVIVNCGFYQNWIGGDQEGRHGSAIRGNARVVNCTFRGNSGPECVRTNNCSDCGVFNSIFHGNVSSTGYSTPTLELDNVVAVWEEGMADPQFVYPLAVVDAGQSAFDAAAFGETVMGRRAGMLRSSSPCVDQGSNDVDLPAIDGASIPAFLGEGAAIRSDAFGYPRVQASRLGGPTRIDIGAVETFLDHNENQLPDSVELLAAATLRVGTSEVHVNLAGDGVANQTDTAPIRPSPRNASGSPWHAIDGDGSPGLSSGFRDGHLGTDSVTENVDTSGSGYWEVDLGGRYRIRRVEVHPIGAGAPTPVLTSAILRVYDGETVAHPVPWTSQFVYSTLRTRGDGQRWQREAS